MEKSILVTGGTGYIGSHTVVALHEYGYKNIVIIDNLSNSKEAVLDKIERISKKRPDFYNGDIRDEKLLDRIFSQHDIGGVLHFAGLKAVGESVEKPLEYYDNNIGGTVTLLKVMKKYNVKKIIFSSSATVYGDPISLPLTEDSILPPVATNPYGTTKLFIEYILKDLTTADKAFNAVILRYFNPVGAHESALIGENPSGIPNNLTPYIARVACGKLPHINIFGNDYPTIDGTGVRDYIHVCDLAEGHVLAYSKLNAAGTHIYNLGTGKGNSVIEVIKAFEKASKKTLPYKICPRRAGDIAACYADASKAKKDLGFTAKRTLDEMCSSLLKFNETIGKE